MTDKPITVHWWTVLSCTPRPIKIASTSHLKKGSA